MYHFEVQNYQTVETKKKKEVCFSKQNTAIWTIFSGSDPKLTMPLKEFQSFH